MDDKKREKYLKVFQAEADEHLKIIREGIIHLESDPQDSEVLKDVIRSAHTLKGSARLVGLKQIGTMAHKMEDLLKAIEAGKQTISSLVMGFLLKGADLIEKLMRSPEQISSEQVEELIQSLSQIAEGKEPAQPEMTEIKPEFKVEIEAGKTPFRESLRVEARRLDRLINFSEQLLINLAKFEHTIFHLDKRMKALDNLFKSHQQTLKSRFPEFYKQLEEIFGQVMKKYKTHSQDYIEFEQNVKEAYFQALSLRMLPISTLFEEFPLAVRNFCQELGKKIELKLEGGELELDRRILEELHGPMVHLLRNAVDHGIEPPGERKKLGKPETGQIRIRAIPKGSRLEIEISDDGKGIDLEKIKARAIELGYFQKDEVEAMGENELRQLIFRPGFSTSEIVTEISGRGVGMDVVKSALDCLGGDIIIETEKGQGTTIRLIVPYTLATLRCLLALFDNTVYIFPIHFLVGCVRTKLEYLQTDRGMPMVKFGQEMIPVYSLGDLLGFDNRSGLPQQNGYLQILILSYAQQKLGVVVDRILREDEIVTKTLPKSFARRVPFVSGTAFLRGEEIALILNVIEIFEEIRRRKFTTAQLTPSIEKEKLRLLVVDDSLTSRIVLRNVLEQAGYEVELAESGRDALEKIDQKDYSLFLVDIEMPGMDGFELTRKIKANPKTKRTPVIIISTRAGDEDKRKGIEAGAQGYIVKGKFEPRELIKIIQNLIGE